MLRLAIIISLAAMFTGCGKKYQAKGLIDQDFEPFVVDFMATYDIEDLDVDMYYADQKGTIIGRCVREGEAKDIEIDPHWWAFASYYGRKQLVFHELIHCVFGQRGHRDYKIEDGCPGSIMNTYHFSDRCFKNNYNYYINEARP